MCRTAEIPIKDLPKKFTRWVHQRIRNYSVTMLATTRDQCNVVPCAGTLVQVLGKKGILTARHVWECIEQNELLLLMVGNALKCETKYLHATPSGDTTILPEVGAKVPDIAFIELSVDKCASLEAYGKTFYDIDGIFDNELPSFYFASFTSEEEAHYVCGFLNSLPVRTWLGGFLLGKQIGTTVFEFMNVPLYEGSDKDCAAIAGISRTAHRNRTGSRDKGFLDDKTETELSHHVQAACST